MSYFLRSRHTIYTALLSTFLSIILVATSSAEVIRPSKKIAYKEVAGKSPLSLEIYKSSSKLSDRPCIVFFFGGGWTGGTTRQFYQQAHHFSQLGYTTICAEYRTAKSHKVTPDKCVEDAKSAIRWVRAHANELGINPKQIIAAGGSAGGHLAACTSLVDGFDLKTEDLTVSSKPNALVLFNPVLDTTGKGYGAGKMKGLGTQLSPCHLVKKDLPPTLVLHGTGDKTVPFENAERFVKLMTLAGNTCKLKSYKGATHGFFNGKWFRKTANEAHYKSTILEMEKFLTELKFITAP